MVNFFLIGPPKTGTTLLARLLDQQRDVACMFESWIWSAKRSVVVPGGANGTLHGFAPGDQERWEAHMRRHLWDDTECVDAYRSQALRSVLSEVLDDFGRRMSASIVGDKWPFYSDRLPLLLDAFPDAVFIHTVRDPRATWHSGEYFRNREVGWDILDGMIRRDEVIRTMFGERNLPLHVVRYEDLVSDPLEVVRTLAGIIGFDSTSLTLDYDTTLDPLPERWGWVPESRESIDVRHATKWRNSMDTDLIRRVEDVTRPFMRRYAYASDTPVGVAVGILMLPGEEAETECLLSGLAALDDPDLGVHVLVNGAPGDVPDFAVQYPRTSVHVAGSNLGVAAGRNLLIAKLAETDTEIVGFLDNDLIVFDDLIDEIRVAFAQMKDARCIGAALFESSAYMTHFGHTLIGTAERAVGSDWTGAENPVLVVSSRIRRGDDWAAKLAVSAQNLGSNTDFEFAYTSADGPLYSAFLRLGRKIPSDRHLYNSGRPDLPSLLESRTHVLCGNVPGGVSFFRTEDARSGAIRYDPAFGPYGAEDVDLSWRLGDEGSQNVVILTSGAIHGTTERQASRRSPSKRFVDQVNVARVRSQLALARWPDDWRRRSLAQGVATLFAEVLHSRGQPASRLLAWMLGTSLAERAATTESRGSDFAWDLELHTNLLTVDNGRFRQGGGRPAVLDRLSAAISRCESAREATDDDVVPLVTELARVAGDLALELDSRFDDVLAHLVAFSVAGDVEGALRCEPRAVPHLP